MSQPRVVKICIRVSVINLKNPSTVEYLFLIIIQPTNNGNMFALLKLIGKGLRRLQQISVIVLVHFLQTHAYFYLHFPPP